MYIITLVDINHMSIFLASHGTGFSALPVLIETEPGRRVQLRGHLQAVVQWLSVAVQGSTAVVRHGICGRLAAGR